MQKVEGSNPFSRLHRHLLILVALAVLASLGWAGDAVAAGTVSIDGSTLVLTGDDTRQFMVIDKEPVTDDSGATIGAEYGVQDTRGGGVVIGSPPCRNDHNGSLCPFGSSTLQVSLGGGDDFFETADRTIGRGFQSGESCLPMQAVASVRLDGGPGRDIVDGSRLADTIAGGTGNDAIASWDGNDHVTGGPGVDLLETHDGADVAEGGPGNDVIHLDANPLDRQSCFRVSGRTYKDVGRGGPGNDAISGQGGGDRLEGGAGNDTMSAFGGSDKLLGGTGRDKIYSRDRHRDFVNCGPGRDVLQASDPSDRVVGCETRFLLPR